MIIQQDEHGNRFVVMRDGARVPVMGASISIILQSPAIMPDGTSTIVSTHDALSLYTTAADYWCKKALALESTVANLRAKLQALGADL